MTRFASGCRTPRLALLCGAALLAGGAHAHIDTATRVEREQMFVPKPERARISALGFDALVADYYWLQAVQVVGGADQGVDGLTPLIARLIDVATGVDPWVDHPYRFAAVWLTDSPESVRAANELLERGIAYHPRDWRNRYHLAFNHFFYLGDQERAAEELESALELPGVPGYLGGLTARLRSERGGLRAAASFLTEMARSTSDPYAQAAYLKALDEVETERAARRLETDRAEFRRRHGRDIRSVHELLAGPDPVRRRLPPAHPHFRDDFEWRIDESTGQIVSTFYGKRYGIHVHPLDAARRERWERDADSETVAR